MGLPICTIVLAFFLSNAYSLSVKPDQKPFLDYLQDQMEKRICEYQGKRYLPGERVETSKCKRCWCPSSGGPIKCVADHPCQTPMCVNPVPVEGQCCPICPRGNNCWAQGKVIPAKQYILIRAGISCYKTCKCPGQSVYDKYGTDTKAVCFNPC